GRRRVVLSGLEHACMRGAAVVLERQGFNIVTVPPEGDGVVDADRFLAACRPDTAVAALLVAHNEIGTLQPVERVAAELSLREILLVADGVQAAGRLATTQPSGDMVLGLLSAHKFGGVAGAGAAIMSPQLDLPPVLPGGAQEHGRRGGTPGVGVLAAMGAAAACAPIASPRSHAALRDRFESLLLEGAAGITILGRNRDRLPNTSGFLAEKIKGEDLVAALDLMGVAVSTGSACSTGAATPSSSLLAMGLDRETARGLVRVSVGPENTMDEMETAAEAVVQAINRLRCHAGLVRASL
ncbi:MAG: cysteine desulfurase family protein, partial [Acidobacteriota bacterium]